VALLLTLNQTAMSSMFGTLAESAMNLSLAEDVLAIIDEELIVFILERSH
jgi:hypothetical protein